jgi:hypothetical protein
MQQLNVNSNNTRDEQRPRSIYKCYTPSSLRGGFDLQQSSKDRKELTK